MKYAKISIIPSGEVFALQTDYEDNVFPPEQPGSIGSVCDYVLNYEDSMRLRNLAHHLVGTLKVAVR